MRSIINGDGSIDVWVEGVCVRFRESGKPEVIPAQPAPADAVVGGSGVESKVEEGSVWLWFGDWYVLIRDGLTQVMPAQPTTSGNEHTLRLYRRRAG